MWTSKNSWTAEIQDSEESVDDGWVKSILPNIDRIEQFYSTPVNSNRRLIGRIAIKDNRFVVYLMKKDGLDDDFSFGEYSAGRAANTDRANHIVELTKRNASMLRSVIDRVPSLPMAKRLVKMAYYAAYGEMTAR